MYWAHRCEKYDGGTLIHLLHELDRVCIEHRTRVGARGIDDIHLRPHERESWKNALPYPWTAFHQWWPLETDIKCTRFRLFAAAGDLALYLQEKSKTMKRLEGTKHIPSEVQTDVLFICDVGRGSAGVIRWLDPDLLKLVEKYGVSASAEVDLSNLRSETAQSCELTTAQLDSDEGYVADDGSDDSSYSLHDRETYRDPIAVNEEHSQLDEFVVAEAVE